MLEQEVASIAKHLAYLGRVENVYFLQIPENFKYPSMFFPLVEQEPFGDTITTFKYDNSIFVKVYAGSSQEASSVAHSVVTEIYRDRLLIPLVDKAGETIDYFRLKNISYKKIDDCVVQIYIRWNSICKYNEITHQKMIKSFFNIRFKEGENGK